MKLTRREWAGALAGATAVPARAPAEGAETPEQLGQQASERVRHLAEALAKAPLPMATEPAFSFKA